MSKNDKRMPLAEAARIADWIAHVLERDGVRFQVCGSLRRGTKPDVGDIDVVVNDLRRAYDTILNERGVSGTFPKAKKNKPTRQASVDLNDGIRVGLYHAYPEEWGAMVLFLTGNHIFNIRMRAEAKLQGLKLNQYGLWEGENVVAGREEEQIFLALGLKYMNPAEREFHPAGRERFEREGV